jgi:hypothetical protein
MFTGCTLNAGTAFSGSSRDVLRPEVERQIELPSERGDEVGVLIRLVRADLVVEMCN